MTNNGWRSVYDSIRPESREEVLTLAYAGSFPAPEDLFDDPDNRVYCVCTYFCPGDQDLNEVPGDPLRGIPTKFKTVVFEEEGFYIQGAVGPRNASVWRRLDEISEGQPCGIICWKRLDYPSVEE